MTRLLRLLGLRRRFRPAPVIDLRVLALGNYSRKRRG